MRGHRAQYIALCHLYITSFALRCADGTAVLGSIYLKRVNLYRFVEDGFFQEEKRRLEKVDRLIRRLESVIA